MNRTELGAAIYTMRKAAGLTQRQLGRAIGYMTNGSISQLEVGYHEPRISTMRRVAEACGYEMIIDFRKKAKP